MRRCKPPDSRRGSRWVAPIFGVAALHVCIETTKACSGSASSWVSSLIPALVGAIVGGAVAFVSAWTLRRGDRASQADRDRIVAELDVVKALVEVQKYVSTCRTQNAGPNWAEACEIWQEGWVRYTPHLDSEDLEEHYQAGGTVLTDLTMEERPSRPFSGASADAHAATRRAG